MSAGVLVGWSEALLGYDLGGEHPLHPVRLELTAALARGLGVLDRPGVEVVGAAPPTTPRSASSTRPSCCTPSASPPTT